MQAAGYHHVSCLQLCRSGLPLSRNGHCNGARKHAGPAAFRL